MSEMLIPARSQPLIAWLLLLLLLLAIIFFGVIPAWLKSQDLSEQIESGYKRLEKMRQVAMAAPELNAEYARISQQGIDKLFYPQGMTAAQVGKELQNQVAAVVARQNGTLFSSEVVDEIQQPAASEEQQTSEYQRVTVQVVFQGKTELLREVLHAAYASRPLIFVDGVEVKPLEGADPKEQLVRVTVKISTYWRGGSKA
ncbi:type II secretion system protein GspM [uncultured Thiothrix sp.]|uniref:type II secretion system protein GspM n=1 Tax=uncultured Thiothrix sp. TaxID=223185 RepID=UPI002618A636|nr:type II secretion system protein GspM [uncultured Thiothrix sp.]HMT94649.1 type II secretion system protein GspM [Thiolinea sp.]